MTQQRHRTQKIATIVALPVISALVFAGCSSGEAGGGSAPGDTVEFSMTYATSNNLESPFETLANTYMEANEGVTIKLQPAPNDTYGDTIRTQLQAGNAPDVIQAEAGSGQTRSILPLAEAGFLEPLGENATALLPAGSENLYGVDGVTFGQPLSLGYVGLVYNQSAAEAAGIREFPSDWAGVEAMCSAMSAQGKSAFLLAGAAGPNAGMTAMNLSATRVYAKNPNWNLDRVDGKVSFAGDSGWEETLTAIVDMKDSGCFQEGAAGAGFDVLTNSLTQGNSLGFFAPLGAAFELKAAAPDQNFEAQAFPPATSDGKRFGIAVASYSLTINAKSDKKDAAKAFLDWVAEPSQATLFADLSGTLPISGLEDLDLSDTWYAPVQDLIVNGDFTALPNAQWPNASVYDALASGVQGLLTGQTSVESVLESMDAAWEQ